jgi:glycosyltransferase involved in cell wall biosynthesis
MLLSIGIRGLLARHEIVKGLLKILSIQIEKSPYPIEVLHFNDLGLDKSGCGMGLKGNRIIDAASGKYVVFVDDDDQVSENYIEKICEVISKQDVDCVGICGTIKSPTGKVGTFKHSLQYKEWEEKEGIFYRSPSQINPIRTSIAKQARFKDDAYNSDFDYSQRVAPFLKTEVHIDDPLYIYVANYEF